MSLAKKLFNPVSAKLFKSGAIYMVLLKGGANDKRYLC